MGKIFKDYGTGKLFSPLVFFGYILSTPKVAFVLDLVVIRDRAESSKNFSCLTLFKSIFPDAQRCFCL
jgi:hypothetical protein